MSKNFLTNVASISIANLLCNLVSVLNVFLLAYFFGTGQELEAYFAALALLATTQRIAQSGQIGEVFLPLYHDVKRKSGEKEAQEVYAIILNWIGIFCIALMIVLILLSYPLTKLIVPGFSVEKQFMVVDMFRMVIPLLLLKIIFNVVNFYFNAEKLFGKPELITLIASITGVAGLIILAPIYGIWGAVYSLFIVDIVRLIGFLVLLKVKLKYKHHFTLKNAHVSWRIILNRLFDTSGYVIATQIFTLAFNAGLSFLPQGVFALFKYSERIYSKTIGLVFRPLNLVFLSYFSELRGNLHKAKELMRSVLNKMLVMAVMVNMAVVVSGVDLIKGFFGTEKFTPEDLKLIHQVIIVYCSLMLVLAIGQISHRISISFGYARSQYLTSSIAQLINAGVTYYFCKFHGVAGALLAIGFSIGLLSIMRSLTVWYYKNSFFYLYNLKLLGKWLLVFAVGLLVGFVLNDEFIVWEDSRWLIILRGMIICMLAFIVSLSIGFFLNIREIRQGVKFLEQFKHQ